MTSYKKFYYILFPKQRRKIIDLFFFIIIGMFLETLGIGVIIPVLGLMTKTETWNEYPILNTILEFLGNPSQATVIIYSMLGLVFIYVIKTAFLIFLASEKNKFAAHLIADLSAYLFKGYLYMPWTFHLQRNSAELMLTIINEVNLLSNTIQSNLILIAEFCMLLGIIVILSIAAPVGTFIIIGVLLLLGGAFYYVLKNKLLNLGISRQHHDGLRMQHLQQGLGGVKDIKLLGRENDFIKQYDFHSKHVASITASIQTMSEFIRLFLELFGVICLSALIVAMIMNSKPLDALLPTVGVFAAIAFRLLPSFNRITGAINNVRYFLPAINRVYEEKQVISGNKLLASNQLLEFKKNIKLANISFIYNKLNVHALQIESMNIKYGECVGFIGSSGAGKSTLVDVILGLLTPDTGHIKVDGVDIQENLRGWQSQIGYVPQTIFLTDDTIRRNIALGIPESEIDDIAVDSALKAASLESFTQNLSLGINTLVGERGVRLSGGQRQRIGIARALYHDPKLLVLDEATSSLDIDTEMEVMQAIDALHGHKTLIIVAHRLSTLSGCDVIYKLDNGKIIYKGDYLSVIDNKEKDEITI